MNCALRRCTLIVAAGLSLAGCNLPRDPQHTTERVRGGRLRVGVVEGAPWVVRGKDNGAEPSGVEPELVRRLARQLNATPEWVWGSEDAHMNALEHHELDLVIGGLTEDTPWNSKVGLSNPYLEERIAVGTPPEEIAPRSLKGQKIAAEEGEATAALLEKKGAIPVRMEAPLPAHTLVAAPVWQLQAWGMRPTKFELAVQKHVFAAAPGENQWLMRLDRFLTEQRPQINTALEEQAVTMLDSRPHQEDLPPRPSGGTL